MTSAGSWFHSLEDLGKKENLRAFLETDCYVLRMTVTCSSFLGELQIIMYIQVNKFVNNFVHHKGLSFLRVSRDLRPIRGQGAFIDFFFQEQFCYQWFWKPVFCTFFVISQPYPSGRKRSCITSTECHHIYIGLLTGTRHLPSQTVRRWWKNSFLSLSHLAKHEVSQVGVFWCSLWGDVEVVYKCFAFCGF